MVEATAAIYDVGTTATLDRVVTATGVQSIVTLRTGDEVASGTGINYIVAAIAA